MSPPAPREPELEVASRLLLRVTRLAGSFLFGQALVQALTLVVGLLLVRILPIEQYALYTIAGSLLAFVSIGSNLGLGQALVSIGAARREDPVYVGALFNAALSDSHRLFGIVVLAAVALAGYMFHGGPWPIYMQALCVALVVSVGLAQVSTSLRRSVFNMHHAAAPIFYTGGVEGLVRLASVMVCLLWPVAILALAANLLGAVAANIIATRRTKSLLDTGALPEAEHHNALRRFVVPIAPILIYTLVQGQIAILLLSRGGYTRAIAEIGALSRLSQLFSVLMMLNPFLVQPILARVASSREFRAKLALVVAALLVLCAVALASAFVAPRLWLLLLGANYSGLANELPIAIGAALATVVGGTLYTIVVARGNTRGQSLAILPCLGGQLAYVAAFGVSSTSDGLMLGLILAMAYAGTQAVLLWKTLRDWQHANQRL